MLRAVSAALRPRAEGGEQVHGAISRDRGATALGVPAEDGRLIERANALGAERRAKRSVPSAFALGERARCDLAAAFVQILWEYVRHRPAPHGVGVVALLVTTLGRLARGTLGELARLFSGDCVEFAQGEAAGLAFAERLVLVKEKPASGRVHAQPEPADLVVPPENVTDRRRLGRIDGPLRYTDARELRRGGIYLPEELRKIRSGN